MVKLNVLAADIHLRMANDNRFGYSWNERWGATKEKWTVDGCTFDMSIGDYDCSSSAITAWKKALECGGIKNPLSGATFTGNMKNAFLATGLFEVIPWQKAERGDVLLNERNHTAIFQGGGKLSEASINEFGGVYGGLRGDQTGNEFHVRTIYNYPWDFALHYKGNQSAGSSNAGSGDNVKPKAKFRVKQGGQWQKENFVGTPGKPIQGIAIDMPGWYQVCTKKYGWLEPVYSYDINSEDGYAGWQDDEVLNVRCYYETPNPSVTGYFYAKYRVSALNKDYYDWQIDNDVSSTMDGYAGDFKPIDRFELVIA